jgi:hypothetical protein
MARRSIAIKRGRYFAAIGIGRYGPYAVGTYRRGRAVAKASVGTRGATVGGRYRVYRRVRVGGEYNFTHHRRTLEFRTRRRILRMRA